MAHGAVRRGGGPRALVESPGQPDGGMELPARMRPARPGAFDQGAGAVNFDDRAALDVPQQAELGDLDEGIGRVNA